MEPIILLNAVGLTPRLLAHAPRLRKLSEQGWMRPLRETLPAVTCTAQATILTGTSPSTHGIVANGWLYRDTREVRFWQQSNQLIQAEPIYETAKRMAKEQGKEFKCAKLFWWFNQGANVDISVTPKPWYGSDGNKVFGIHGSPDGLTDRLEKKLGKFPFHTFWGPKAGAGCTEWIGQCAAEVIDSERPHLTLVYLPHLDYDPQRFGPEACDMPKLVGELDDACEPILDIAQKAGAKVWVVSEYGHITVNRAIEINRALRKAGFLTVRNGPFGEVLETFESRAFAVVDHQIAHIYVRDAEDIPRVRETLEPLPGIAQLYGGEEQAEIELNHERSGELIALSEPDAWFAYPYWLDDALAPDFARTVDIHRKPGFDPCELFFDKKLWWPMGRAMRRLLQKKLGFRTLFDVVPLDTAMVRGCHGLRAGDIQDNPLLIATGEMPQESTLPMTKVHEKLLSQLTMTQNT